MQIALEQQLLLSLSISVLLTVVLCCCRDDVHTFQALETELTENGTLSIVF